ncbi:helix-turn-helix domain-containing protein, partial [Mitsuokella jalaludinii]
MCHYTHLTPFEREKILFFLAEGKSITEIAHLLNRSKSTISRELLRNAAPADQPMSYCPLTAQALYKQRRKACRPHKRLEYAPLHSYIQICILAYHWSPEEIVGRIQLEHGCRLVSVPT